MRGTNSQYNKTTNLRLILNILTKQGAVPRVEIAKQTYLTKQTISNLTDTLDKAGLIRELGVKRKGVGKPTTQLSLNPNGAFSIGIRVRFNLIEAGMYNIAGEQIAYHRFPLEQIDANKIASILDEICNMLMHKNKIPKTKILGIGLVLPASSRFHQVKDDSLSHDILQLEQISKNIQKQLSDKIQLPVIVENIASAVASKETFYGAAKNLKSFVYIYLGHSIDASFIFDKNLFISHNGIAGRLGHLIVETDGRECSCGNYGCLNQYASLNALEKFIAKKIKKPIKIADILDNAKKYEKYLTLWFEDMSEAMRIGIHSLENLFNAETIILGSDAPDWFLDRFIRVLRPFLPSVAQFSNRALPRLIRAPSEDKSAIKGAATLPIYFALTQDKQQLNIAQSAEFEESPIDRINALIDTSYQTAS